MVRRWLFDQIHSRTLLYNQCWEDPQVDHAALEITGADRIVMITSAGCNALDYLSRGALRIDCVDMNPRQTALLELKLAAIERLSYAEFFSMFGRGRIAAHRDVYTRRLRPLLSVPSRRIWDKSIDYFAPNGAGLYFHGAAGMVARMFQWHIRRTPGLADKLRHFQAIRSLPEQADFYRQEIAPAIWRPSIRWMLRRSAAMSLFGVPIEQIRQIRGAASTDLSACIRQRVDRIFTARSIADNYFWRVYINGCYTHDCCPAYLKPENFPLLRERRGRIRAYTATVTEFLTHTPDEYSIYVLLDHMDWLADSPEMLAQEWRQILRTAEPGARIIYRSGGETFDHIPGFALDRLQMHRERANLLHQSDRVGTYGSFHLASVNG